MPIYEYCCPTCGNKFQKLQSMSADGSDCPVCEQPANRAISVFASVTRSEFAGGQAGPPAPLGGGGCCGGGCACS
jgi:putative FmdB family regulatory protein